MMGKLRSVVLLVAVAACLPLGLRPARTCFLAATPEPRWLRLAGLGGGDSTGRADVGLWGVSAVAGRWWQLAGDSVRVDAGGPFDSVWLRLHVRGDSVSGTARVSTDANITGPPTPTRPWTARRGPCPQ